MFDVLLLRYVCDFDGESAAHERRQPDGQGGHHGLAEYQSHGLRAACHFRGIPFDVRYR